MKRIGLLVLSIILVVTAVTAVQVNGPGLTDQELSGLVLPEHSAVVSEGGMISRPAQPQILVPDPVTTTEPGLPKIGATITVCASGCSYKKVQDAINAAHAGDIILVEAGTYAESLTVNKTLTIRGVNGTPIIGDPTTDATVMVNGDGVNLDNLRFTSAKRWNIKIFGDQTTLTNLNLTAHNPDDPVDPVINGSELSGVILTGCKLASTGAFGMYLDNSKGVIANNNQIDLIENKDNIHKGISLSYRKGGIYDGIYIFNNTMTSGGIDVTGPYMGNFTIMPNMKDVYIHNNTIRNPNFFGIILGMIEGTKGIITNITVTNNRVLNNDGTYPSIRIETISGGLIKKNVVMNSFGGADGIYLNNIDKCSILENTVKNGQGHWITGQAGFALTQITNSTVSGNSVLKFEPYGFYYAPGAQMRPNLTLDASNRADGRPIMYYEGKSDVTLNGGKPAMVIFLSCSNMTVKNAIILNSGLGLGVYESTGTKISGSRIGDCFTGMMLIRSSDSSIKRNTFNGSFMGMGIGDNSNAIVSDNVFSGYVDSGIVLHSGSSDKVIISQNRLYGSNGGSEQAIVGSDLTGNGIGIVNNTMIRNTRGVLLYQASNLKIMKNTIKGGYVGFNFIGANNNVITDNKILNTDKYSEGFFISNSEALGGGVCIDNQITNNYIMSQKAVNITYVEKPSLDFELNVRGPDIWGPEVERARPSAISDTYHNDWNTTKTLGTNIVGGPYLGGNYYARADGKGFSQITPDNGQGFCTKPYQFDDKNIDHLPLHLH